MKRDQTASIVIADDLIETLLEQVMLVKLAHQLYDEGFVDDSVLEFSSLVQDIYFLNYDRALSDYDAIISDCLDAYEEPIAAE